MLDTRVSNRCCACYITASGGLAWPLRCRKWSAAARDASSMKAVVPKTQCDWSLLMYLWSSYMLTLPALRPWWSQIKPQTWWTFWSFATLYETCHGIHDPQSNCKKTVAKFLWHRYISIFGAPAKLLSDWETNFESNIIRELCELIGIQKVRTSTLLFSN